MFVDRFTDRHAQPGRRQRAARLPVRAHLPAHPRGRARRTVGHGLQDAFADDRIALPLRNRSGQLVGQPLRFGITLTVSQGLDARHQRARISPREPAGIAQEGFDFLQGVAAFQQRLDRAHAGCKVGRFLDHADLDQLDLGQLAAALADLAVVTSDNPRTEDPDAIIDDIESGMGSARHLRFTERRAAIAAWAGSIVKWPPMGSMACAASPSSTAWPPRCQ